MRRPLPASERDSRNTPNGSRPHRDRHRSSTGPVHRDREIVPAVGAGTPHGLIDPPPPGEVIRDQQTPTSTRRDGRGRRPGPRPDVGPGPGRRGRTGHVQRARLLQDHRFPTRLHPARHRPLRGPRRGTRLRDRAHRGRRGLQRRGPGPLRRGRLAVHHRRRPERGPAGRLRELRPGGRRLRRRPLRLRHPLRLGVVRRTGRRVLLQPPARHPGRRGHGQRPGPPLHRHAPGELGAARRVVRLRRQPTR